MKKYMRMLAIYTIMIVSLLFFIAGQYIFGLFFWSDSKWLVMPFFLIPLILYLPALLLAFRVLRKKKLQEKGLAVYTLIAISLSILYYLYNIIRIVVGTPNIPWVYTLASLLLIPIWIFAYLFLKRQKNIMYIEHSN
ncbi:MAG: hypothetical protein V1679_01645 [Candidatus Peregrinibacteria bacterium]